LAEVGGRRGQDLGRAGEPALKAPGSQRWKSPAGVRLRPRLTGTCRQPVATMRAFAPDEHL